MKAYLYPSAKLLLARGQLSDLMVMLTMGYSFDPKHVMPENVSGEVERAAVPNVRMSEKGDMIVFHGDPVVWKGSIKATGAVVYASKGLVCCYDFEEERSSHNHEFVLRLPDGIVAF